MRGALSRYLKTVRRQSTHQEVFLALKSPFLPLRRDGLYTVSKRLMALDLRAAITHHGPHCLRHACAARLLAEGLCLKEISDHLGHHPPNRLQCLFGLAPLQQITRSSA